MPAGQYEALQRREPCLEPIDNGLESTRVPRPELREQGGSGRARDSCNPCAEAKKAALHFQQICPQPKVLRGQSGKERPKSAVELVHVAARFYAAVVLAELVPR